MHKTSVYRVEDPIENFKIKISIREVIKWIKYDQFDILRQHRCLDFQIPSQIATRTYPNHINK